MDETMRTDLLDQAQTLEEVEKTEEKKRKSQEALHVRCSPDMKAWVEQYKKENKIYEQDIGNMALEMFRAAKEAEKRAIWCAGLLISSRRLYVVLTGSLTEGKKPAFVTDCPITAQKAVDRINKLNDERWKATETAKGWRAEQLQRVASMPSVVRPSMEAGIEETYRTMIEAIDTTMPGQYIDQAVIVEVEEILDVPLTLSKD